MTSVNREVSWNVIHSFANFLKILGMQMEVPNDIPSPRNIWDSSRQFFFFFFFFFFFLKRYIAQTLNSERAYIHQNMHIRTKVIKIALFGIFSNTKNAWKFLFLKYGFWLSFSLLFATLLIKCFHDFVYLPGKPFFILQPLF